MILRRPLVFIGLDAFEFTVLEKLIAEDRLPHLGALLKRGNYRRLLGEGPGLQGAIWRAFMTGRPLGEHGWFFRKLWRPETGRIEPASASWLPASPFWAQLDEHLKVAVVDVPHATASPSCGIHVDGWQTHDEATLYASPPSLLNDLRARFGEHVLKAEKYGPQSPAALREASKTAAAAAEQVGEIGAWLQDSDRFDLFLMVLGSPHRAGHYLWTVPGSTARQELPSEELLKVYEACDAAVGRLVEAAPDDATVAVFALHGMGPNSGWVDRFGRIVRLIHDGPQSSGRVPGWRSGLHQLRRTELARVASRSLPASVNHCIGRLWSRQMYHWPRTRFFSVPDEEHGCVRVNLRGREPQGIVEPGAGYERLLDELQASFQNMVDLETGRPIARSITRVDKFIDVNAPGRAYLPDLIVDWNDVSASDSTGVRIPRIGEVRWEPEGQITSGRTGAHSQDGWLVVCDPAVDAGSRGASTPAVSLVPSLLHGIERELLTGEPVGNTFINLLDEAARKSLKGATAPQSSAAQSSAERSSAAKQWRELAAAEHAERKHKGQRKGA